MAVSWVDRRRDAATEETDEAFLDRVDLLVMAEWGRLQRESHLDELYTAYAVRAQFLSLLQELFAIRRSTGSITSLPTREELRMMLSAVRVQHEGAAAPRPEYPGWELPEDEELAEWSLDPLPIDEPRPDRSPLVSRHPGSEGG